MSGWTPTNVDINQLDIDDILKINGITKLLQQKISSDTYCNLNVFSGHNKKIAPDGHNRYILGFWFEVFDENHFLELYNNNPQAEFLILSDMNPNDIKNFARCRYVQLYHWNWFLDQTVSNPDWSLRKYKLSSLSNRVNEFRCFITAKLLNLDGVFFTWNAQYLNNTGYDYIFSPAGWPLRDNLIKTMFQLKVPINNESFANDPSQVLSLSGAHSAYTESLINSINETKDNSWHQEFGVLPGPYLTEKTWKPLINGNALLFSGQYGIQQTLENFGFEFDYPWQNNYSNIIGDLERLDRLLELIDEILKMPAKDIISGIKDSVLHNQNLISTGMIQKKIELENQNSLDLLTTLL